MKYSINNIMGKCSRYNVIILNAKGTIYSYTFRKKKAKGKAQECKVILGG